MNTAPVLAAVALALSAPWPLLGQAVPAAARGEFRVGDQILLRVQGDSVLSDTFTVGPGLAITLPEIGEISLAGVSPSELQAHLTRQLGRYLKQPVLQAFSLMRISIVGEVEHPGFYPLPGHLVISDAIMRAGGPTQEAAVPKLRVEREGTRIWEGEALQQAIADGRTLDQMNLRPGDRIFFPRLVPPDPDRTWRILAIIVTLPAAIYGITRIAQ